LNYVRDAAEAVVAAPLNFDVRVVRGQGLLDGGVGTWFFQSRVLFVVALGF